MSISLVDPKTGQVYEAPDEAGAQAQIQAYGLDRATPEQVAGYDQQQQSGSFGSQLLTIPETAAATYSKGLEALDKFLSHGRPYIHAGSDADPFQRAFSPEAQERRAANPGAAMIGAAVPDLAIQSALGGEGLIPMGIRALAGGAAAASGQAAITNQEFSPKEAALYGLTGGVLEGVTHLALGQAMRAVGKGRSALDGLVERARKTALLEASVEKSPAARARLLIEHADDFYGLHQTNLDEALGVINQRIGTAPDRVFSMSALKKSVAQNEAAQADHFLEVAVKLRQAADVSEDPVLEQTTQIVQDALETNGPRMFDALRRAQAHLAGNLPESPLAHEALEALDSSLSNERIWGKAAKNHVDFSGIADQPPATAFSVRELDAREALDQRLAQARQYAAATGDKKVQKAIQRAEAAIAGADEVTGARVMGVPKGMDAATEEGPAAASRRRTVDRLRAEAGYPAREEPKPAGILGRAKKFGNDLAEYELDNFVQNALKGTGGLVGHAIGGIPGGIAGYLTGRWLHIRFGDQITHFAWESAKKVLLQEAKKAPGTAAAVAGAAVLGGAAAGPMGAVAAAAAARRGVAAAAEKAAQVAEEAKGLGESWSRRLWKRAKKAAKDNPGGIAGAALIGGATAAQAAGQKEDGTNENTPLAANAGLIGLMALIGGFGNRRALTEQLGESLQRLSARERMTLRMVTERAAEENAAVVRQLARGELPAHHTAEDIYQSFFDRILQKYAALEGIPHNEAMNQVSEDMLQAVVADTQLRLANLVEHDEELAAAARPLRALPGGREPVQGSPELRRMGLPEPGQTAIREAPGGQVSIEGQAPTNEQLRGSRVEGRVRAAEDALQEGDIPEGPGRDWNRRMNLIHTASFETIGAATADDLDRAARQFAAGWESDYRQMVGSPPNARATEYVEAQFRSAMELRQRYVRGVEDGMHGRSYSPETQDVRQRIARGGITGEPRINPYEGIQRYRQGQDERMASLRGELPNAPEMPENMRVHARDLRETLVDSVSGNTTPDEIVRQARYHAAGWAQLYARSTGVAPTQAMRDAVESDLVIAGQRQLNEIRGNGERFERGLAEHNAARSRDEIQHGEAPEETAREQRARAVREAVAGLNGRVLPTEAAVAVTTGVESLLRQIDGPMGEDELQRLVGSEARHWFRKFRETVGREPSIAEQEYARAVFMDRAGQHLERYATGPERVTAPHAQDRFDRAIEGDAAWQRIRDRERGGMERPEDFRLTPPEGSAAEPAVVHGLERGMAARLDEHLSDDLDELSRRLEHTESANEHPVAKEIRGRVLERAREWGRQFPEVGEEAAEKFAKERFDEQIDAFQTDPDEMMDAAAHKLGQGDYTLDAENLITQIREDGHELSPAMERAIESRFDVRESELRGHWQRAQLDEDHLFDLGARAARSLGERDISLSSSDLIEEIRAFGDELTDAEEEWIRNRYYNSNDFEEHHALGQEDYLAEHGDDESPPSSEPEGHYNPSGERDPNVEDGLPPTAALQAAGLDRVSMQDSRGIYNVFGEEGLSLGELEQMLALRDLKSLGSEGRPVTTHLRVHDGEVIFDADGPGVDVTMNYERSNSLNGGLKLYAARLFLPQTLQGQGIAKKLIRSAFPVLEAKGMTSMKVNAADVGKYAWLALGLRPGPEAEAAAKAAFERTMGNFVERDALQGALANIQNTRDLADATVPIRSVSPQALDQLRNQFGPQAQALLVRGDELKVGKAFLLTQMGAWNHDLKLTIDRNDPWYQEFLRRVGLLSAAGLSIGELVKAFQSGSMEFGTGDSSAQGEQPMLDDASKLVQAQQDQEHAAKIADTQQKLKYVAAQGRALTQSTARALVTPAVQQARKAPVTPGITHSAGVASFLGNQSTLRAAYEDKKTTLQRLATDPMALIDEMSEQLGDLADATPELHRKTVEKTYEIVQFLQTKLPGTIGASLARPDGSPPSDTALRQFALYYSAATNPSSVYADLANNRARKEQMDTLRTVWKDEFYDDLKVAILDQMSTGQRPSFAQRIRLDLLFDFGGVLDRSLSNDLVATLTQYRQKQPDQPKGAKMPTRRTNPSIVGTSATASLSRGATAIGT